jgi:hypothetical protein
MNVPLTLNKNVPLSLVVQYSDSKRRYSNSQEIINLAIDKFKKNGKGIKYGDLLSSGLVQHKKQGQRTLKYFLQKGILFTIRDSRPQAYYAASLKSEVMQKMNARINPTGVTYFSQPLEDYILPLLPSAPLHVHNIHFKLKITPECYSELRLPAGPQNNGKRHSEIIGNAHITYTLYPAGIVNVEVQCSNYPFKLQDESDRSRVLTFFGQVRDRLVVFLMDRHERIVPGIMEWNITECDINKDIKVSDWLHFSALKIQVKHLDHLFRIYIKSMGEDTVCRVEESLHPKNKRVIETINDIFNPTELVMNS